MDYENMKDKELIEALWNKGDPLSKEASDRLEECIQDLDWWQKFRARGAQNSLEKEGRHHGCKCKSTRNDDGTFTWNLRTDCKYHTQAARYPSDHTIPWNCPTFWDGCNCKARIEELEATLKAYST